MNKYQWSNWSGGVVCYPEQIIRPASVDEIVEVVKTAVSQNKTIRLIGAGHSFTPVAQTDSLMVSLDNYQGIESVDDETGYVKVRAGTRLHQLGQALQAHGLAQENLGDINVQSIAGAVSTGTHGTGASLRTIATQVVAMTLVNGHGERVTISAAENSKLLNAARISLGMLGIIVDVTLRTVPAYKLHAQIQPAQLDDVLTHLSTHKANRHFEFFWFPHTQAVQLKEMNITDAPAQKEGFGTWLNDVVIENGAFELISRLSRRFPNRTPQFNRLSGRFISEVEKVNHSHKVFATTRTVRFEEMEYNIPAEAFTDCVREIEATIDRQQFAVNFPIECRFVAADEIWLSPAYQRESAYLAVHMYKGMPYQEYFAAMERIFKKFNGRPHWGKRHNFTPEDVHASYPKAAEFLQTRETMDPQGIFLNDHLKNTFGL